MRSVWPCLLTDYMCMCSMNEIPESEGTPSDAIKGDYMKRNTRREILPYYGIKMCCHRGGDSDGRRIIGIHWPVALWAHKKRMGLR